MEGKILVTLPDTDMRSIYLQQYDTPEVPPSSEASEFIEGGESQRLAEEHRNAEQERLAAERRYAEQQRLAAERREAEQQRLAAQRREAEQRKLAAQRREAEQRKLAAQRREAEKQRLAAQRREAEKQRLAAQRREAEQQKLAAQRREAEQQRIVAERREAEQQRKRKVEQEKTIKNLREKALKNHRRRQLIGLGVCILLSISAIYATGFIIVPCIVTSVLYGSWMVLANRIIKKQLVGMTAKEDLVEKAIPEAGESLKHHPHLFTPAYQMSSQEGFQMDAGEVIRDDEDFSLKTRIVS